MQNHIHGPFGSFKLRPKVNPRLQEGVPSDPDLHARESIRNQLAELEAERNTLKKRFGCESFSDVTRMIESMEAQLKDFYGRQATNGFTNSRTAPAASTSIRLEAFLTEIGCDSLDQALSMINSLQQQLHQLYAEGETRAAEQALCSMYEEKQTFHDRFGFSGVEETAAMISSMESQLRDFYSRQAYAA